MSCNVCVSVDANFWLQQLQQTNSALKADSKDCSLNIVVLTETSSISVRCKQRSMTTVWLSLPNEIIVYLQKYLFTF